MSPNVVDLNLILMKLLKDSFVTISIYNPLLIFLMSYSILGSIESTALKSDAVTSELGIFCCNVAIIGQLTIKYEIRLIQ